MRNHLIALLTLLLFTQCAHQKAGRSSRVRPEGFVADIMLPVTPVKNQGMSELCWVYAALAALETERLCHGDSVNLSPLWLERASLEEQALRAATTGEEVVLRGTLPEAMRLFHRHGIVPYDSYRPLNTFGRPAESHEKRTSIISKKVWHLATTKSRHRAPLTQISEQVSSLLDDELGCPPHRVFMLGAEYTPLEFAHSIALPSDWKALTSFTHHPYGKTFDLEVPDNRRHHEVMNIQPDSLLNLTIRSLLQRHPVMWEGAMNWNLKGDRQTLFERHLLTDDHCMCIVGLGHDKDNNKYFILKNSHGANTGDHGMRYMPVSQFLNTTIMIMATGL